jgi:hypothetical protein
MNQHRLVIDRKIVEWDYASNQDMPAEDRLLYMLFYQMSRMCREKGAVKHDDRLDALAGAVKYYTDSLAISAYEQVKNRKQQELKDMMELWLDDPEAAVSVLAFGMNLEQRHQRKAFNPKNSPKWVSL